MCFGRLAKLVVKTCEFRCLFLFEAVDEPAPRRPWRAVSPIDGRHCYNFALGRSFLDPDLNERAACKVRLDGVQRHAAKPEPCAQEDMFGLRM